MESIYNLVPKEYAPQERQPMYRSKHDPKTIPTGSTFGCQGSTRLPGAGTISKKDGALFGPPNGEISKFSTKATSTNSFKDRINKEFHYSDKRKNLTPTVEDKPIIGIRSNKNFVVANAVEAILQVPKRPEAKELDYVKKEDFGKVPAYLSKVKEEMAREREVIEKFVKDQLGTNDESPELLEEMSEFERCQLILALKAKWEAVNNKFQKMSHHVVLDTEGQIRRKEKLEREMQQLETDISRLERSGTIIVRK